MVSEFEVFDEMERLTDIAQEDRETCLDICKKCMDKTRRSLKSGEDESDPRVVWAAAAMALYVWTIRNSVSGSGEYSSFKAGDITVSQSSTQKNNKVSFAKELYLEAQRDLAPLVEDNSFYVGKIDV